MTATIPEAEALTAQDVPDAFATLAADLQATATTDTAAVVAAWTAGAIITSELQSALLSVLTSSTSTAWHLSDSLAAELLGVAPLGIAPAPSVQVRHAKAVDTLTKTLDTAPESLLPRATRLTSSEAVEALGRGLVDSYARHGIHGYVRGLDADPCELCVWLKKEHLRPGGFIYPTTQPMHRHPGCCCSPIPVLQAPQYRSRGNRNDR